ncbi:hypothetical protein K435DRAFT_875630 [Dendrothele bispora CBS 962.96]|uniref:Uncharacterized protein n=1 Tax=Dendrothele bispora (strain CBS 962.96) TaxID=1314807 RepID=A0A4S8KTZ3_DENBC|nr:hypothetical protein K435DRAFT_875630 [Dendrothele bispora CBS 962.96]
MNQQKRKRSEQEKLIENLKKVNEYLKKICTDFGLSENFFNSSFGTRDANGPRIYVTLTIARFNPSWQCADAEEQRAKAFLLDGDPADIPYARPGLWQPYF